MASARATHSGLAVEGADMSFLIETLEAGSLLLAAKGIGQCPSAPDGL